ncbi:MAG: phosphoribosyl-ATP diphosphatase, partial [Actinobacteria bacterium]|nr:phosphoribosyl-ATP diphosphatase [Actinomycetota bacterium]
KGQTSGNIQLIKEIRYDCDSDALLFQVEQKGFACHTGKRSCFFNIIATQKDKFDLKNAESIAAKLKFSSCKSGDIIVLEELYSIIIQRFKEQDEKSYTFKLHKEGIDEILKKFGEESIETILSAKHQSQERLISEIADLVYHLLVLMAEKKVSLYDICTELKSRRR